MNGVIAPPPKIRLLIVDDEPVHMTALYQTLEDAGYDVTAFPSATQALKALHEQSFDLILTDLQMPEMDGIQFLRAARETDPNLVGIVMTGHGAIDTAIEAMKAGALDYVLKPFKLSTIRPVLSRALEVRRLRLENAQLHESLAQGIDDLQQTESALTKSRNALTNTEAALATAREEEKKATLRATHDATTGLPNRGLFDDRLSHAISLAERHNWTLAVMFLDLDRFKSTNDTHGHVVGDWVLKEVAKRLSQHARDEDTVCRNGGDEFLCLLMNPQGSENIGRIARSVLTNIAQPIDVGGLRLVIKSSIGIAVYPDDGTNGDQLISNADTAMYCAKKGMSGCVFFNALEAEKTSASAPEPAWKTTYRHT